MKQYFVYILSNKKNGTLYVGVTNDLIKRAADHKQGLGSVFTSRYGIHTLVYYETTNDINAAIEREKNIKAWKRKWKIELIESMNPDWEDLSLDF